MSMICVQFVPPYSNRAKRIEVAYKGEGYLLRDWLRQQGAAADVVLVLEDVTVLDHPNDKPAPSKCPRCGGPADNGHDRDMPPNPYCCSKCAPTDGDPHPASMADGTCIVCGFDGQ